MKSRKPHFIHRGLVIALFLSIFSFIPVITVTNVANAAQLNTLKFSRNKVAAVHIQTGNGYPNCYTKAATCTVQKNPTLYNTNHEMNLESGGYFQLEKAVDESGRWVWAGGTYRWRVKACTKKGVCKVEKDIGHVWAFKAGSYFIFRSPNASYNWIFSLGDEDPYLRPNGTEFSWTYDGPGTGREGEYKDGPRSISASITGENRVGETLEAGATYVGVDSQLTYVWKRSNTGNGNSFQAIAGATNQTYIASSDDSGKFLRVDITATNYFGNKSAVSSTVEIAPVATQLDSTFGTVTSTLGGFTVNVNNYNADFQYSAATTAGIVTVGTASGSNLPLTITGLTSAQSANVTVTTTRAGVPNGTGSVSGAALASAITTSTGPVGRWIASSIARTAQTILIANQNGYLYTSTDKGVNWAQRADIRNWSSVAQSDDGTVMFATVAGGRIFKSTNSGQTWTATASNQNWRSISCDADCSVVLAAASGGKLWVTTNSGSTWSERESNRLWRSVALSDDGATMVALPYNDQTFISFDTGASWGNGGNRWSKPKWVAAAVSANGEKIIGAQANGLITYSESQGNAWSFEPENDSITSIALAKDADLLMRCNTAGKITVKDGGTRTDHTATEQLPWSSCSISGDGSIRLGTTTTGLLYISTDSAGTWNAISLSTGNVKRRAIVASENGAQIFSAIYGGKIEYSSDSGNTWSVALDVKQNWIAMAASQNLQKIYALGYRGHIYRSLDAGLTWTKVNDNGGPLSWISVAASEDGSKVVVAEMGGNIYTSTDSGDEWVPRDSKRKWVSVASSSNGAKLVAAVQGGFIYTSSNSGESWTQRATSQKWSAIASSSNGNKLVATVAQGRIYTSTNSGETWTARSSNRNWLNVVSSTSGNKLIAVVGAGRIYYSENSGGSWSAADSTRNWRALFITGNGNRAYAADFGKKLYVSTNSGESWTAL
ncbi:MAG: hypothetical protein ACO3FB_03750 [Candidatus Nanopelagicaceae bacterium]